MGQMLFLSGSGSGTLPAGTSFVEFEEVGGGGGGGGAGTGVANLAFPGIAGGGGGASGVYRRREIAIGTDLTYSWSCGQGGAGGDGTGTPGAPGGITSITLNATTFSVAGGSGGSGPVAATTVNGTVTSTIAPGAPTNAFAASLFELMLQAPGGHGTTTAGAGGGTPMGAGGYGGGNVFSNGFAGTGAGGGGGGALGSTLHPKLGGAGAPGAVVLTVH